MHKEEYKTNLKQTQILEKAQNTIIFKKDNRQNKKKKYTKRFQIMSVANCESGRLNKQLGTFNYKLNIKCKIYLVIIYSVAKNLL